MNINSNLSKSELVAYSLSSLPGGLGIVFYYGAKLLQRDKIVNNLQYLTAPTSIATGGSKSPDHFASNIWRFHRSPRLK